MRSCQLLQAELTVRLEIMCLQSLVLESINTNNISYCFHMRESDLHSDLYNISVDLHTDNDASAIVNVFDNLICFN